MGEPFRGAGEGLATCRRYGGGRSRGQEEIVARGAAVGKHAAARPRTAVRTLEQRYTAKERRLDGTLGRPVPVVLHVPKVRCGERALV